METFGGKKKHTHTHTHTALHYCAPLHSSYKNKMKTQKKTLKNDKRSRNPQKFGGETETEESCERERRRLFRLCNKRRENLFSLSSSLLAFVCSPPPPPPPLPTRPSLLAPPVTLWRASYYPKLRGSLLPPSPRKTQPTTLFVESCGVINIKWPLHMHMPYKSTLPTPSCLLPTPHSILTISLFVYLFISFRLIGWFFFPFQFFIFYFF